jgi:hypothetical protein
VESLTPVQIQTLFGGKIVGWYGFGGSDRPVRLLAPPPSSGEFQALRRISPGGDFRLPPSAELVPLPPFPRRSVRSAPWTGIDEPRLLERERCPEAAAAALRCASFPPPFPWSAASTP